MKERAVNNPLFIPLKTEYFDAFKNGIKNEELRLYGSRWNERTCSPGREVILSKGYGKQDRLSGRILCFRNLPGTSERLFRHRKSIMDVFGTLDVNIACISITDIRPVSGSAIKLKRTTA